ncbi:MAG: GspE/PulE family protein [bacterium]
MKFLENIGELLIDAKEITSQQLQDAIKEMNKSGGSVDYNLVKLGFIGEDRINPLLSKFSGFPSIDLNRYDINLSLLKEISEETCKKYKIIPIDKRKNVLTIAMTNPLDLEVIEKIKFMTGYEIQQIICSEFSILKSIEKFYTKEKEWEFTLSFTDEVSVVEKEEVNLEELKKSVKECPVVKVINQIIHGAVLKGATDVHMEPYDQSFRVRYRIDGILREEFFLPISSKRAFISRIKVMADLDIAEMRLPQDGRIRLKISNKIIDIRVSSIPVIYGEKIVLRISDKSRVSLDLKSLGFFQEDVDLIEEKLKIPVGLILAVGPSGSGKTTTLYSLIEKINSPTINIITAEDPVEFQIKGINQLQINVKAGLLFSNSLKNFFRQNPDVMMIGEIRDSETAQIAVKGAITGHLILSCLHANDAISAIVRLINMKIEPYLLSSALRMIIAQRLLRKICLNCKEEKKYPKDLLYQLGIKDEAEIENLKFFVGTGCSSCDKTGYKGRIAVYEKLIITREMRELISSGFSFQEMKELTRKNKMVSMFQNALYRAKQGIVSLEEVMRITIQE